MPTYKDYAQERTVVAGLQRYLLDKFIESDSQQKEGMVCEEVFVSESAVTQETFLRVFEKLQLWENNQRQQMSKFRWKEEDGKLPFEDPNQPPPPKDVRDAAAEEEAPKPAKRSRKKKSDDGSDT